MHFLLKSISTPQAKGCKLSPLHGERGERRRERGVQGEEGSALGRVGTPGAGSVHGVSGGRASTSDQMPGAAAAEPLC